MKRSSTRWFRLADLLVAALLIAPAYGCVSAGSYDELALERDRLQEENERLDATIQGFETARVQALEQGEDLRVERDRLAREVRTLTKRVKELEAALAQHERARGTSGSLSVERQARWAPLLEELQPEVQSGLVSLSERPDGLQLLVSEELLFSPGKSQLSVGGRALLERVALRVRDDDQRVEVEGGADVPALRLSRGAAVMRALAAGGIPNEQLRAGSFGDAAVVEGAAPPPRSATEIRLLPNFGAGPGIAPAAQQSALPGAAQR
jgi:flagellar motor protein MotB